MKDRTTTEDLMMKVGDDVTSAIKRTLAIAEDNRLLIAISGGAAALGLIVAALQAGGGSYDPNNPPDSDAILFAALVLAYSSFEDCDDPIAAARRDLPKLAAD